MAEDSLHDFSSFLNRLLCRRFPFEPQKLHVFHVVSCCASAFWRLVRGRRREPNFEDDIIRRKLHPVHAQVRHETGSLTHVHLCCGKEAKIHYQVFIV
jgi:hypothetical protein